MKGYVQIQGQIQGPGGSISMSEQTERDATAREKNVDRNVVSVINPLGGSRVVLVCEHAANAIPDEFDGLGLSEEARQSHIAWDLGAQQVAAAMSAELDAPLVAHRVSRLVFDCNRSPDAHDAIPDLSECQDIPGNAGLSAAERMARTARFYTPFCDTLSACLEQRIKAAQTDGALPVLVTIHSFTPVYKNETRTVEIGILHDSDTRLADEMLKHADRMGTATVMRNAPYGPSDGVTFTLARHGVPRNLLNVMVEIRNDLIADAESQQAMARRLSACVNGALAALEPDDNEIAQVS